MQTYRDLFDICINNEETSVIPFLTEAWKGKDKQESLFRLFAYLNLIQEFRRHEICVGNFNIGTIKPCVDRSKLFEQCLKDKGDKSDLTLMSDTTILVTTSKNLDKYGIGDLDIDSLLAIYDKIYKTSEKSLRLCVVVRDKNVLRNLVRNSEKSSARISELILRPNTLIYDWSDLNLWYNVCRKTYSTKTLSDITQTTKPPLVCRFHQEIGITKTLELFKKGNKSVLWGHIPRSGKTYMMGGLIIADGGNNYLCISTAPSETTQQYMEMFCNHSQFGGYTIISLTGKDKKPRLGRKNIIVVSKQYLQSKGVRRGSEEKRIKWLMDIKFDGRFLDESHNGGVTELSQGILSVYGKDSPTVFITATYFKPLNTYNIPEDAWILWNMEDIRLCKTENRNELVKKHGDIVSEVVQKYTGGQLHDEYDLYPELHLLTWDFNPEAKCELVEITNSTKEGFSTDAIFLLKHDGHKALHEFQNEEIVLKLCRTLFEKSSTPQCGMFSKHSDSFLNRIEKICKNGRINSRWFSVDEPLTIMCYLPCGLQNCPLDAIQDTLRVLMERNNILPDFEIVCVSSQLNRGENPVKIIEDARTITRNKRKSGLLVLSGKQCSMAVSLSHCDIVLMLNNTESMDTYYQMMFRCLTEASGKKCGFVVDLNLQRVTSVMMDYALKVHGDCGAMRAIGYVLEQRLILLNSDEWLRDYFEITSIDVDAIASKLYEIYTSKPSNAIESILKNLDLKVDIFGKDQAIFNEIFYVPSNDRKIKRIVSELTKETEVEKGMEKIRSDSDSDMSNKTHEEKRNVNLMTDVMRHLVPLICLLTIDNDKETTFSAMCDELKRNGEKNDIFMDQIGTWWGSDLLKSEKIIDVFRLIYDMYLVNVQEFNLIVARLKEMFNIAKTNPSELSKIIDRYLTPQEMERKNNAEVSTPYFLRQNMLDTIPKEFWTKPRRVFEPCAGKGGFLLDIIARFKNGLVDLYPDETERYRCIVEECLYWSDINPVNVYICRLLLSPFGNHNLKYNLGDTLKLNTKEKWEVEEFDAVIGNPPYSTDPSKKDTKPLYNLFIEAFVDKCRYLLFVTPSRWFSGGKGLDRFRRMMLSRQDIRTIVHTDNASVWFGKMVNIMGGCSYFLIDKKYHGVTDFNGTLCKMDKYDIFVKPKFHGIVDRMIGYESIEKIYMNRGFYGMETNDRRLKNIGKIRVHVSLQKNKNRVMFVDEYDFENKMTHKVVTASANGLCPKFGNYKCVLKPEEIYTNSYVGFMVKNEQEGKFLISYLNCKLPNHMLSIRKLTQNINTSTIKWIPLVPLDRIWTDESVYAYFDMTPEEIQLIQ